MGQQLIGRPLSQRTSFGTLNTPSSPFAPVPQMQIPSVSPIPPVPGSGDRGGIVMGDGRRRNPISDLISAGQFGYGPPFTLGGFKGFGGMPRYGLFRGPMNG